MADWERALNLIEADKGVLAIILTAAGDQTFSAGGDLKYFAGLRTERAVKAMSERMQAILNRLYEGPRPVIGAINGNAYGGGCEILTACHFRIAAEGTAFQFRQSAMGVVTGWGGGLRLFRLLGRSHALELLLTGERLESAQAQRMGLVDHVVPPTLLMNQSQAFAERMASRAPDAVEAFLDLSRFAEDHGSEAVKTRETELFVSCWRGPWFQKALTAFLDRNKA